MRDVNSLNSRLRTTSIDLAAAPNLTDLRQALGKLIGTAQDLEAKIVEIRLSES